MGTGTSRDFTEARRYFEEASQKGSIPAKRMLGFCYINGYGTAVNFGKAAEWFEKAAQRNDRESGRMLAICYKYGGNYLTQDENKARIIADKFGYDYNSL